MDTPVEAGHKSPSQSGKKGGPNRALRFRFRFSVSGFGFRFPVSRKGYDMALTPAIIKATITQGLAAWNEATSNEPTDIEGTVYRITDATITMAYEWRRLSARATDANEAAGYLTHCLGWAATALEVDGLWHATTLTDLLVRKSTLYGTSNHELYGILGIMVRISDKVSRMQSLITHRHASPEAEYRWRDTLYDIAGYAVLGLLLLEKGSNEG